MRSGRGLGLYCSSVEGSTGLVGFEERSCPSPSGMWAACVPRAEIARATTRPTSPFFILHSPLLITRGPSAAAVDSSHRRGSISISVHCPAGGANPLSYLHQVELGGVVIEASAEEPGFLPNRIFSRSERPERTLQVRRADTLLLSAPVMQFASTAYPAPFSAVPLSRTCSRPGYFWMVPG